MPSADHFAGLHQTFAQRKAEVRAKVFDGVQAIIASEYRDPQTFSLDGMAKALSRNFREAGDAYPFLCLQFLHECQ